jgi:prolipoprotein diacylglyceryltransferase
MSGLVAALPSPSTGTIEIGPLSIHMYGITLLVAIVCAIGLTGLRWTRRGGDWDLVLRAAVWGVAAGIVGARLYHVVTSYDQLPDEWYGPIAVWEGGLGI